MRSGLRGCEEGFRRESWEMYHLFADHFVQKLG